MTDISISVNYDSDECDSVQLEVELRNEPFLFGTWDVDARLKGQVLRPVGNWTEICVHNENDCDFLEIDLPLTKDYRLQRFFLLDNADQILILGDTLLWDGDAEKPAIQNALCYESRLLFSPSMQIQADRQATELNFCPIKSRAAKPSVRVLPLALPEWKATQPQLSQPILGSLTAEDNALILRQEIVGRALFAPLFFDLNPKRQKKNYTWRHLTVGEDLKRVPEDQAVGYHVRLGKEQYLLYHSMTPPANRTVLGHNLIDDLCFARFDPSTGVEALVEVQQELD